MRKLITSQISTNNGSLFEKFLSKILTHPERVYFRGRFGCNEKVYSNIDPVAQFLAGRYVDQRPLHSLVTNKHRLRFAAKEACRKACDHLDKYTRGLKHIIILPVTEVAREEHQSQRPQGLILHEAFPEPGSKAAEEAVFDMESLDGQLCEISISHEEEYATAVALVPSMKQHEVMSEAGGQAVR